MASYRTPGVYIEEKDAFSTSIVAVPTAVPAFIGYTQTARRGTKSVLGIPTRITSFAEYRALFGEGYQTQYMIQRLGTGSNLDYGVMQEIKDPANPATVTATTKDTLFNLYNSIKLFYSNGGGTCYIVSVGLYEEEESNEDGTVTKKVTAKTKDALIKGIDALKKFPEPTMVVIPDAVLLPPKEGCSPVQEHMINHCGAEMKSRVAILDVFGMEEILAQEPVNQSSKASEMMDAFKLGIGNNTLDFAAAYYPWLNTTITSASEVSFKNIAPGQNGLDVLNALLKAELGDPPPKDKAALVKKRNMIEGQIDLLTKGIKPAADAPAPAGDADADADAAAAPAPATDDDRERAEQAVKTLSPLYRDILKDVRANLNLLPPSGAIAGLYSYVDNSESVARSPANFSLSGVVSPAIAISNEEQEDLNVPLDGKAINAIRSFPGKGTLVWGARTLDGNSQDWRYISVRRAVIMMEQSIKIALGAFVFQPNVQNTWLDVQSSITNFLTTQWNNGVLAGATPGESFSVAVGLGVTMTPQDILDGYMRVEVKLAVVRPAEFIVVTFQQQMQTS